MPCQAWFIMGPSNSTLDYDRHYIYAHSRWTIGTDRQAFAEILSSWPARRPFRRDERPCVSDGYGYGVIPILHLAHEKCLPLLATFTWITPPTRARTPSAIPICTQLCTLVEPLAPAAVHSVQRCTLNGQRPRMPDADQPISWRSENP